MSSSGMSKEIALTELNVPQLNQLSQQLDQELEVLQSSMAQLKIAQGKFNDSKESLNKISPANLDKDILVPLTSSMYVSGKLSDVETVLVDIGTGYYVEKSITAAKDYYQRKVEFVTAQLEKIQPILQEKYRFKEAVMELLQLRVQAQMSAQHSAAAKS